MKLNGLKNKKIAIAGFAREGMQTLDFLLENKIAAHLTVADEKKLSEFDADSRKTINKHPKIKFCLGPDAFRNLKDCDVIIRSPGVPPRKIKKFLNKNGIITSPTDIFFSNFQGRIIGVTATKGKSTTASLIHKILSDCGLDARLAGNIGIPALSLLKKTNKKSLCVYELSSAQLCDMKQSPWIAIWLNIFNEHLDFHDTFVNYLACKSNIALHQGIGDYLIYNSKCAPIKKFAARSKARKVDIQSPSLEKQNAKIKSPFLADFYKDNIKASLAAAEIFNLPFNAVKRAIESFHPLEHRLEFFGAHKGIDFINDSLATNPQATMAAIAALNDRLHTIILGGYDRGLSYNSLAACVLDSNIKTIILLPTTGQKIWAEIEKIARKTGKNPPMHFHARDMKETVDLCYQYTPKSKICLLSCAAASFGMFKNYEERGKLFKKFVKNAGA